LAKKVEHLMESQEQPNSPEPQLSDRPSAGADLGDLIVAARKGDAEAWKALVRRYTPLVNAVTRRYRLALADAEDVSQMVWLKLFENLAGLRETRALPGWIKTTAQREALRILNARRRTQPMDPSVLIGLDPQSPDEGADSALLRMERNRAVQHGLAELAPEHRRLLVLLHAEPRASYKEISTTLGMPPGSIGPTRARCLVKLRKTEAMRALAEPCADPNDFEAA
jgi:RNA polymerase sigma factor (sigma-70 family)